MKGEMGQGSGERRHKAIDLRWSQLHRTMQLAAQPHGMSSRAYGNSTPWKSHIGGRRIESFSTSPSSLLHWLELDLLNVTTLCTSELFPVCIGQHFS